MEKYPLLFRSEGPRSGFGIAEGWMPMVSTLCSVLNNHLTYSVPEEIRGEMYVVQVKEKFGGLRFYMNQETPYMSGAIALAESMSFSICEICGGAAKPRSQGYISTLCDLHHEKEKERRKKELEQSKLEELQRAAEEDQAQETARKP